MTGRSSLTKLLLQCLFLGVLFVGCTSAFLSLAPPSTSTGQHHQPSRQGIAGRTSLSSSKKNMSPEEYEIAMEKATKSMTAFTNKYLKNTETKLCTDMGVPAVVIKGLAEHKVDLGAPLCPCRFYEDKEKEAKDGYWNCPCVPMRERHECHCMLFLTEDNDFAGEESVCTFNSIA